LALNEVWLEIVALAHDLIVWTQALVLDAELAKAEPKRPRYRLPHVAGRFSFSRRRAKLHLQDTWPWAAELLAAFEKLKTLAVATGCHQPPATHHHQCPGSRSGACRVHPGAACRHAYLQLGAIGGEDARVSSNSAMNKARPLAQTSARRADGYAT
jgi:hypothetical protein